VKLTPHWRELALRDRSAFNEKRGDLKFVECLGAFREEKGIRKCHPLALGLGIGRSHIEEQLADFEVHVLVHFFGSCVYNQTGHHCTILTIKECESFVPPSLRDKLPIGFIPVSMWSNIEEAKSTAITPFMVRLVEGWMAKVDCEDFIIREAFKSEVPAAEVGAAPVVWLEFIVEAEVEDFGRVALFLIFHRQRNKLAFENFNFMLRSCQTEFVPLEK
jgi:hypothetical protein